jgi:DNA-binding NarL/FixJ family response regulator
MHRWTPRTVDLGAAALLTAGTQVEVWAGLVAGPPRPLLAATCLVGTIAAAWHRIAPMAVLVVVLTALAVAPGALGADDNTAFAWFIAVFAVIVSAGYHARRPILALALTLGLLAATVVLATGPVIADVAYACLLGTGGWLAGGTIASRTLRAELSEQRAALAEQQARWRAAAAVTDGSNRSAWPAFAPPSRRPARSDRCRRVWTGPPTGSSRRRSPTCCGTPPRPGSTALMDVRMPRLDGIAATRRLLAEEVIATRIVVLTTFDVDAHVYDALRAGASAFLLKTAPPEDLVQAIRVVAAGAGLLDPAVTRRVIEAFARSPAPGSLPPVVGTLTERELEVLHQVARGLSNAEIAATLVVSEATVKTHVARTLAKLGLRDRVQVVVYAYEHGLVRPGAG